jgi:hypothetical protein
MTRHAPRLGAPTLAACLAACLAAGCRGDRAAPPADADLDWPRRAADMVQLVIEADRAVYTRHVVNRLTIEQQVIAASEQWKSDPGTLPLPAQMFRMGAERVLEQDRGLSYVLLSPWPINKQNRPRTELEVTGLAEVARRPGEAFYGTEDLGGTTYFTAIYADVAVAPACVDCHNEHRDSPRRDFALGDVMGGVVIRFPL